MKRKIAVAIAATIATMPAAFGQLPTGSVSAAQAHYVFFDFGRPILSRDAEATLDDVVQVANAVPGVVVEVRGYSDAAGPRRANATVSRKRAEVVRSFLEARGIPHNQIRMSSHGEDGLLVPTADGVREPQNRRVEIRVVHQGS